MDRTSLQVHSRSSSPYDWSTRSELHPEAKTPQPGQQGTTRMHIHRNSTHTHTRHWRRNTTASPRLRREAGRCCCRVAATAAAAAAAAAVLLLCCCCAAAASRPAIHRRAQPVTTDCFSFCIFWNARRSEYRHSSSSSSSSNSSSSSDGGGGTAAAAGPATGEAKTYVRVYC